MADQVTKKTLLNVEINSSEAINNIAELKKQVSELRTKQKELDTSTDQGRQQYEAYGQQIKALTSESRTYEKQIQSTVKANNEQEGSIQKLKAQLSLQTAEYNKLSSAQREAADGKAMQASIKATSDKLKELEKSLGDNRRSVGDYELATRKLPGVFGEMQASATQAYSSIKDNLAQGKQMIAEYIAAKEAEKLAQAEAAIAAELAVRAEAELAAAEAAGTATAEQTAVAESARAAATTAATTATEAGTTAMKLLKIAIASTGIGILVVALGAIVAYFTSTNEGAKKFQQIMNGINAVVQSGVKILGSYGKLLFAIATFDLDKIKEGWKEIGENIKNATGNIADNYKAAEQNTKNQQMMAKREREWSGERLKLLKEYEDAKIMAGKRSALDDAGKEAAAKKALQINEQIYQNDLKIAQQKAIMIENEQKLVSKKDYQAIQDAKNKVQEIINAHSQQQLTIGNLLGKTEQRIEAANTAEVASTNKKVSEKQKAEIKSDEAILASKIIAQGKVEELRLSDEQYYQQRLKMISDNADAEKLIVQKKIDFHIITAEEAANALVAIEKEKTDTIADLDAKKLDVVISNLEYEAQMADLKLQEQLAGKIRTDEEMHLAELQRIQSDVDLQVKEQDAKLANDKSYQAEHDRQVELIRQKGRTATAQEDATFDQKQKELKDQRIRTNLSNEFELAKGDLNKEHKLKLQQLDLDRQAEIESAKKTGADVALINEKYAKIEQDLAAETKQKKIENVLEYARAAQDGLSALNDLLSALGERELKAATEKNTSKKNDLDKQLKAGLISQQEHDYQVALSAYELDKKTDKINREAAIRDKALKATQTIINTAAAVVSMLALGPAGIPLSIAAGVTGALQLAAIRATPLPSSTAGTAPKFSDFAATGSGSDSGTSSSDKESEAAQKALDKAAEDAKKAAEKAQSEYEKAKEAAEKAIQDAKDLADKLAQEEKDRADKAIMDAWKKSDDAIAEASKRADDISAKAQQALANALSALEKAQSAVLDIQAKIDKKAADKISEEEKKRIEAIEAAEKEILDAQKSADKTVEDAQKSADKAAEDAREKELAYLELLQQAQDSTKNAEELQRAADIALSNSQSRSGMLWYQPELKAALRKQAEDAQKAADKAKEDAEKKAEKLEEARIAAENARIASETAQKALESALLAQSSAAEAAKQATLAAEERAKQAAEAAQRASDEEDARWQRELEAAKQAEIEAQAAVEQAKLDAEAAKKEAELAAQKKLEAELAAEERKAAYDAAQEEKRRIANEEAQAKADKTAREAQEAANNASKAAALAAEAAALAAAAAGWTSAGTITPTDNGGIIPEDFNSNPKILDRNLGFNSDFKFKDTSGYQSRTNNESNNLSKKDIQEAMTSAVKELKIYTTIEDIRKQDQNYTIIESRGTV